MTNEKIEIFSAPGEPYSEHIEKTLNEWNKLSSRFKISISRLIDIQENKALELIDKIILFHDLGKLSSKWQDKIVNNPRNNNGPRRKKQRPFNGNNRGGRGGGSNFNA